MYNAYLEEKMTYLLSIVKQNVRKEYNIEISINVTGIEEFILMQNPCMIL